MAPERYVNAPIYVRRAFWLGLLGFAFACLGLFTGDESWWLIFLGYEATLALAIVRWKLQAGPAPHRPASDHR